MTDTEPSTTTDFQRPLPPPARRTAERSGGAQSIERAVGELGAIALASPALAFPLIWPVVAVAVRLAVGAQRRSADPAEGSSLGVALMATLASGATKVRKRVIRGLVVGLLLTALTLVAVAALAGLAWLATEGSDGALVAARMAVYDHALSALSAVICWRVIRGRAPGQDVRAIISKRFLATAADGAMLGIGAAFLLITIAFAVVVPSAHWAPWGSFGGLVQALPDATSQAVFDIQRDAVEAEADAVLQCLAEEDEDLGWSATAVAADDPGRLSVRIGRQPRGASTRADVTALVLALDNQLPDAVSTLAVKRVSKYSALEIDRTVARHDGPVRETVALAAAADVAPDLLPVTDRAVSLGLRCGAAAL